MRILQIILSGLALSAAWAQYPSDLFRPEPNMTDSVSVRSYSDLPDHGGRLDLFTVHKDAQGRPLRQIARQPTNSVDSGVVDYEWNLPIRLVGQAWDGSASRTEKTLFSKGSLTIHQVHSAEWNPISRNLIIRMTPPDSGCPWSDSAQLDDQNRIVGMSKCYRVENHTGLIDTSDVITYSNEMHVFRAWYENPTDTLPRRASLRFSNGIQLEDSVFTVGPANRPDTLRGTEVHAVIRDGSGRILKLRAPDGSDSTTFTYDEQGRLTSEIHSAESGQTYFYSWSDDVGLRRLANPGPFSIRLAGDRLLLSLPLAGTVHVEAIAPNGKHRVVYDGFRPSGAASIPVQVGAGEIVRVKTPGFEGAVRAVR